MSSQTERRLWTRREVLRRAGSVLGGVLGTALGPGVASAIGTGSLFKVARIRWPGLGRPRHSGLFTLLEEVRTQTSIDTATDVFEWPLRDEAWLDNPFAILVGDRRPGRPPAKDLLRLKAWLEAGGTLFVDNVGTHAPSTAFDRAWRAVLKELFPSIPLVKVPAEHVLYRAFYKIDYPAGRLLVRPWLEAIPLEGRLAVIYSQNDITGAWCRDAFGRWEFDVRPGGEAQRSVALRMGINLVEYTLCQDYKDDQVHLDYLLHRRKWKITPARIP